jgi:hypothetical protein
VTGRPSDLSQPFTSTVNYVETVPNAAILPLSRPSGRISLFTFDSAHLADTAESTSRSGRATSAR